ncbi:transmembrane protein [Heterostelium album PN500]|uniref:Transmembrane protein n=1 Tax=Heterostelium pallidum (strain ATCC 26659 / Pp 5 / PN500) TaxID=670386 RepID=D3B6Z8_HETP5|nr:transmembrane protein [Heterostelium album PN500]EFA82541.1 transmembrane protein [Heterostelium album PN500]|eukprot:XP_020434658.1 transmembrane protein [Heterostelium album PN500]
MPQRTFSPRTFMGDRGIVLDSYGRVLKNESFSSIYDNDKKIVAPKPWKTSNVTHFSNSQFEEAGQEIQTIILNSFIGDFDDLVGHNDFFENQQNNFGIGKNHLNISNSSIGTTIGHSRNNSTSSSTTTFNSSNNVVQCNSSNSNNNSNSNNSSSSVKATNKSSDNENNECKVNINDFPINSLSIIENYAQDSTSSIIELKIPLFTQSPGLITEPITPPTRTHNPITLNQAFASDINRMMEIDVENDIENDLYDINSSLIEQLPNTVEELMQHSAVQRQLKNQPVYLKYFWKILLIISVFYFLPSIQFVFFQYEDNAQCYFNFKCAHEFLGLKAFNNAGGSFLLILHFTAPKEDGINGLHTDMSLYYCVGVSVLCEGFSSALYHVCPSKLNFQFDTTYMLIGSGLLFFTVHQKRHATFTAGAFRAYSFFAMFIFLNFLSLTAISGYIFWSIFFILFAYISISGSGYLLAHKRLSINPSVSVLWNYVKKIRHPSEVEDKPRLFAIILAFVLNWGIVLASSIVGIGLGFYFFEIAVTNKFLPFDESKELNKPCVVFGYFDTHDVWHFFSAVGLFTVMSVVYFIDYDLRNVPRSLIHVF